MRASLSAVAPGTALRDGLERILRGNTGGLIVLGSDKTVEAMCTGGFVLDVEFSATRLRELCKLDGGIVVSSDLSKILRAGVQLVPDPNIPTEETGTRHRTADRVSKQVAYSVISVSQSMRLIALYVDGQRRVLEDSAAILSRANQALATLERYKLRLDEVAGTLSALEIEDLVTVRDVSAVVQRLEMVRLIATEIAGYVLELGTDGRLLALQLEELIAGVEPERELVVRDYVPEPTAKRSRTVDEALAELDALSHAELLELSTVAKALGYTGSPETLDSAVSPAASASWRRCRACPARSSTAWWNTSGACRSCWRRASTTSRRWTGSARRGRAACGKDCRGWRSRRFWSGTCRRAAEMGPKGRRVRPFTLLLGPGSAAPPRSFSQSCSVLLSPCPARRTSGPSGSPGPVPPRGRCRLSPIPPSGSRTRGRSPCGPTRRCT